MEAQRDKMYLALDRLKNRDIVTFHKAFPYFAKEFNLNMAGVIEREPGSTPSAKELAETIDQVKSRTRRFTMVFVSSFSYSGHV